MSDGTRTPATRDEQRLVWRRLRQTLRPRATATQLIVGLLCLLVGLSIVVQVRQTEEQSLEDLSQAELVQLLDETGRHAADLEHENAELDRTLEQLRTGQSDDASARAAAEERLEDLEILAGTIPAQGRGVVLSISDPGATVRASTLLGVLQELRNAGAEVIQIGDVRVVASSAITTDDQGRILVDGSAIRAPYEIRAIGDPAVMEPALRIPGGAVDDVASDGGTLAVAVEDVVRVEAIAQLPEPVHSQVVK